MKLFKDLPDKDTAINAENLNQIQNNLTIVSPTEPTGENREKVWIQKGKNLVTNLYKGTYYNAELNQIMHNNTNVAGTGYIEIKPNIEYVFSNNLNTQYGYISIFDENYNFIEFIKPDTIITPFTILNENAKYVYINI